MKKEVLRNCKQPNNVKELHSFLGLSGWVLRTFVPQYSTLVEPLSSMIKKNSQWSWGDKQEKYYHQIMKKLEEQLKLHHFDPNLVTKVYTDASPVGIGKSCGTRMAMKRQFSVLVTHFLMWKEGTHKLREREALALVWACEKLHMYLYGGKFTLVTDHQALLCIYGNRKKNTACKNFKVGNQTTGLRL